MQKKSNSQYMLTLFACSDNSEESDVGDNRWLLNGYDISSKFFAYRAECIAKKGIQGYDVIDGLEQVL